MPDQVAAEWGLFNANFSWLADRLAAAVFYLQRRKDPNLCFEAIIKRPFGKNLAEFESKLRGFEDLDHPYVQGGLAACKEMRALAAWRNERIHARVEFDQQNRAIKLFSWKTRQLLPMTPEEIAGRTTNAFNLVFEVNRALSFLLNRLDFQAELDRLFGEIDLSNV